MEVQCTCLEALRSAGPAGSFIIIRYHNDFVQVAHLRMSSDTSSHRYQLCHYAESALGPDRTPRTVPERRPQVETAVGVAQVDRGCTGCVLCFSCYLTEQSLTAKIAKINEKMMSPTLNAHSEEQGES